jgi:D-amino-acid oxidase
VCGRHTDVISLRLSKTWRQTSYRAFQKLNDILPADGESGHGIRLRTANFFFDKPLETNPEEYEKMVEIEAAKVHHSSSMPSHNSIAYFV